VGRSDAEDRASARRGHRARAPRVEQHVRTLFDNVAKANEGKVLSFSVSNYLDHPAGGCRMGTDPKESGLRQLRPDRHDHHNLFVPGAPTLPKPAAPMER